jgi:hypothetical protein
MFKVKQNNKQGISEQRINNSAVDIATGYGMDDRGVGVRVPVGSSILSSPLRPDLLWGPPCLRLYECRGLFSLVGREADR